MYALFVNKFMRVYDYKMAQKVDYFIANSQNTAKRIEKYYNRDSKIIYPPIDLHPAKASSNKNYFLTGGRFVAAKNFDLIIKACKLAEVKLKIFGSGILEEELKQLSNSSVEFLGKVSDEELINLYGSARAFILAQKDEDFGMTSVEAQAGGTPVIAYRGGGYVETVVENKTGIFFDDLTVDSIVKAINKFKKSKIKSSDCVSNAQKYSKSEFKKSITSFVNKTLLK
jgi:glycosyltransferase involved in cell wall biosynthesis